MKPILENFNCKLILQILVKEGMSLEHKLHQQYYFKKKDFQHKEMLKGRTRQGTVKY